MHDYLQSNSIGFLWSIFSLIEQQQPNKQSGNSESILLLNSITLYLNKQLLYDPTWSHQSGPVEGVGAGVGGAGGEPDQGGEGGEVGPPHLTHQGPPVLRVRELEALASLHSLHQPFQLSQVQPTEQVGDPPPPPGVPLLHLLPRLAIFQSAESGQ